MKQKLSLKMIVAALGLSFRCQPTQFDDYISEPPHTAHKIEYWDSPPFYVWKRCFVNLRSEEDFYREISPGGERK